MSTKKFGALVYVIVVGWPVAVVFAVLVEVFRWLHRTFDAAENRVIAHLTPIVEYVNDRSET